MARAARLVVPRGVAGWARLAVVVALVLLAGGLYAWTVTRDYQSARAQIARLRTDARLGTEGGQPQAADLPLLVDDARGAERDLRRLQDRLNLPLVAPLASHVPYLGPRLRAAQDAIDIGVEFATIARRAGEIGLDVEAAYRAQGLVAVDAAPDGPTWLDVLRDRQAEIDGLSARFDAARAQRAGLREALLPERARHMLAQFDPLLARAADLRDRYLPTLSLLEAALGADGDARYLVLLQDSQELHQSGGFPGADATVVLRAGQVSDYDIQNIRVFDSAYVAHRDVVLPAPAPIRKYVLQQELLPHDVNWLPDFPSVGQELVEMNAIAQLPPLNGVVAIEYSVVEDVLRVVGPLSVEVDGVTREVDADNVISVIESYRDYQETHKAVERLIGVALIERLQSADGAQRAAIARGLLDAANRREIQFYAVDPATQGELHAHGWGGALVPDPATPTLAMTISNLTPNKSSSKIRVTSDVALAPASDGGLQVTWTITLRHTGDPDGDPAYNGFHRTWLALYLPDGATRLRPSRVPAPPTLYTDPRERAWVVAINPGASATLTLRFELPPGTSTLLLRRQPGLTDVQTRVHGAVAECALDTAFALSRDQRVDLRACVVAPARPAVSS